MTSVKSPNVKIRSGSERNSRTGRKNAFRIPSNKVATSKPGALTYSDIQVSRSEFEREFPPG